MRRLSSIFLILLGVVSLKSNYARAQETADSASKSHVSEVLHLDHNVILNDSFLRNFYAQLELVKQGKRDKITILHIGDSHIQGDYFSGAIRVGLQEIFGNAGRGLVFPYAAAKSYAPVDITTTTNIPWIAKRNFFNEDSVPLGVTGYAIVNNQADFQLRMGIKNMSGSDNAFDQITVIHGNDSNHYDLALCSDDITAANGLKEIASFSCNDRPQIPWGVHRVHLGTPMEEFILRGIKSNSTQNQARIYGFVLENTQNKGVLYHTAGVGAAQLVNFTRTSAFLDQAAVLKPDLIIFSLGTNESYSTYFDTLGYQNLIENVVQELRIRLPESAFLFTTPPDIVYKYRHPKYMHPVCRAIKRASLNQQFAVWDLNFIMGGESSMHQWHSNLLAQSDRIHFRSTGYKLQGYMFLDALIYSYNLTAKEPLDAAYIAEYIQRNKPVQQNITPVQIPKKQSGASGVYGYKYHVVKQGETLSGIARKYGTSVNKLCQLNGITPKTLLRIGRRLRVR